MFRLNWWLMIWVISFEGFVSSSNCEMINGWCHKHSFLSWYSWHDGHDDVMVWTILKSYEWIHKANYTECAIQSSESHKAEWSTVSKCNNSAISSNASIASPISCIWTWFIDRRALRIGLDDNDCPGLRNSCSINYK